MATTDVERLRTALSAADFPAQKADLVRAAEAAEADGETIRALNSIPPVEYANLDEVERSVPFEPGPEDVRDREAPPHPIVEELGENRGS